MSRSGRDARSLPQADPFVERFFEPVDTRGPKALLGLAWVLAVVAAVGLGYGALAVLFGALASVAALQTVQVWSREGLEPSRQVAGVAALAIPVAAALGTGLAGAVFVAASLSALLVGVSRPGPGGVLVTAGVTVRCFAAPALAATSVVLLGRVSWSVAAALLALVIAYDLAAYVWGADSSGPLVGRAVGVATVIAVTFSLSVIQMVFGLEPFGNTVAIWVFGALAATLCPLGQLLASATLPSATAKAPALRRIDSLLLAGPIWLWTLWGYMA